MPARTGRAGALLRPPVVAEPGRRVVCRCCERCLLSNRVLRVGVAYSLTGLSGSAFPSLRRDARTNGARWCSAPPPVMAEPGRRVVCHCCERCLLSNRVLRASVAYSLTGLRVSVAYSLTGLSGSAFPSLRRDARTNGARWCSAPPSRCGRVWASRSVSLLRSGVPYSPTGCGGRALLTL